MPALLLDEFEVERVLESRKESGSYCWVEVWDGLYVVPPLPDNRHADLSILFVTAFRESLQTTGARYCGHVNVSDRNKDWLTNVRCPDSAVFLPDNPAHDRFTHWQGEPDLLVEVMMPNDRSRDKLGFYGEIGTKEVLVLDRDPWQL
jgi:Uma2 family endonuclease